MNRCQYPACHRQARYFIGWNNGDGKHFGLVCGTHNRKLGRENLMQTGMSLDECILFERYLRVVPEEVFYPNKHPDFPEWLEEYYKKHPIRRRREQTTRK